MRLGIIADPLHTLKPSMDTTLLIAAEAHARGHEVRYAGFDDLSRTQDGATAKFGHLKYSEAEADRFTDTMGDLKREPLDAMDVIVMRQDPPVNERYMAITYLLDGTKTPVINNPGQVRDFNEKICVMDVPKLSPPSLSTLSTEEVLEYWQASPNGVVVKPLNAFNGIGVDLLKSDMSVEEARKIADEATENSQKFTMVQHFVPAVTKGDKRFFLIDGEPIGRMNRVPAEGDYRANIHRGAQPAQFDPSDRDLEILAGVKDLMSGYDLPMVCIDVIGDYLTEINVTSPSGIPEINRVYGDGHEKSLVDLLERRAQKGE